MTQEEIVRNLQANQQALNAALAREKNAELEIEDARNERIRNEGAIGVWTALLNRLAAQQAAKESPNG